MRRPLGTQAKRTVLGRRAADKVGRGRNLFVRRAVDLRRTVLRAVTRRSRGIGGTFSLPFARLYHTWRPALFSADASRLPRNTRTFSFSPLRSMLQLTAARPAVLVLAVQRIAYDVVGNRLAVMAGQLVLPIAISPQVYGLVSNAVPSVPVVKAYFTLPGMLPLRS